MPNSPSLLLNVVYSLNNCYLELECVTSWYILASYAPFPPFAYLLFSNYKLIHVTLDILLNFQKQHAEPSLVNVYEDPAVQDYIKKQNAYFKMIDEFELSEEEVYSISDS